MDDRQIRERVSRLEQLLAELDGLAEPARSAALEAVSGLLEVYGEALARIVRLTGAHTASSLARDELVGHLLLVHDLHPRDVLERVSDALDDVSTGQVRAEIVALDQGTLRLRVEAGSGCGSTGEALEAAAREAALAAAPEIERVEIEGAGAKGVPLPMVAGGGGVPLPMAASGPGAGAA